MSQMFHPVKQVFETFPLPREHLVMFETVTFQDKKHDNATKPGFHATITL